MSKNNTQKGEKIRARIVEVNIKNWRVFSDMELTFKSPTILLAPPAGGKTAFCEAISTCLTGKLTKLLPVSHLSRGKTMAYVKVCVKDLEAYEKCAECIVKDDIDMRAGELKASLLYITSSDLSMQVGVEKKIKKMFGKNFDVQLEGVLVDRLKNGRRKFIPRKYDFVEFLLEKLWNNMSVFLENLNVSNFSPKDMIYFYQKAWNGSQTYTELCNLIEWLSVFYLKKRVERRDIGVILLDQPFLSLSLSLILPLVRRLGETGNLILYLSNGEGCLDLKEVREVFYITSLSKR